MKLLSYRQVIHLALGLIASLAISGVASSESGAGWIVVEYGSLVDRRKLTHSGETVGALLDRLDGRGLPPSGERRDDALAYRLLDPILEPYAFVLADALDSLSPPPDPPMVEVGELWEPGEPQPAWVELARARNLLLESDGEGHLRACVPALAESVDAPTAAKQAWEDAWPVLRHALAGERRRLAERNGGKPPGLEVEVHAYRHELARSRFALGVTPWRTTIDDTRPHGDASPLDLAALTSILDRGLRIEGGRLDPSGRVVWFVSEPDVKPSILGRTPTLADLAVAYRAVARGGYGEPYMSLDRSWTTQTADVNYGGRLRDTALGTVSLMSDVRFKTFSVGIDLLGAGDIRDVIRRTLPGFRTHLERFAADPSAGAVLNQQTRFWFYPDDVDLTLSAEGDILAFRRVRMTAASERVPEAGGGGGAADPPWTRETIAYLNAHYDALATMFPEMSDLDETVRWLSLFTWLEVAKARGLAVPDLDALLAIELPSQPTPRRFPQLLSYDTLPPAGGAGVVDVLDRTVVGTALDRLEPPGGKPLPADDRFRRSLAMLNRQMPDQAALAAEMEAKASGTDAPTFDALASRAERLLMHTRVLATLSPSERASVDARRAADPEIRIFSIGIGGVDLGTSAILARASARGTKLGLGSVAPRVTAPAGVPVTSTRHDAPPELPVNPWPDHGLGPAAERTTTTLPDGRGVIASRRRPGALVRRGTWKIGDTKPVTWMEFVLGMDGLEARSRRRVPDPEATAPVFERLEDGRFLQYRFDRTADGMRATPAAGRLPAQAFGVDGAEAQEATGGIPSGLTLLNLQAATPASVTVRLRGSDGRDRSAPIPRPLLQRLVVGPEVDLTPGRPLPAFTPASEVLGASRTLMVMQSAAETAVPWSGTIGQRPGEEDTSRLTALLTRWWATSPPSPPARAVVGVDAVRSPARWAGAATLDGGVTLIAPADAFPGGTAALRSPLAAFASTTPSRLVIVVSTEPPGVLGKRLRAIASDPAFAGKIVAVAAFGGGMREDLPASLLSQGGWSAFGLFEAGPVGLPRAIDEVARWAKAAASPASKGQRAEEVSGPFTWYY